MWCRAAQSAANFRKDPKGSEVLQSFSVRASAAVLSDALGSANFQVVAPSALRATIAKASCASVSKQAMYCCWLPVSCGQTDLICSAVQCSANQAQCVAVTIQPPTPTWVSSAMRPQRHNTSARGIAAVDAVFHVRSIAAASAELTCCLQ